MHLGQATFTEELPIFSFSESVQLLLILSECSAVEGKMHTSCCYATPELPWGHKWAGCWFILFFSCSLSAASQKGGLPDLRVSDAELQRCGRKVCACLLCAVCVPLQLLLVCRMAWRLTDCSVGVVILPDSLSLSPWSVCSVLSRWPW